MSRSIIIGQDRQEDGETVNHLMGRGGGGGPSEHSETQARSIIS